MPPILQMQVQRSPGDCALCALSMALNIPFEDVLAAAVKATNSGRVHHLGMTTAQIKRTAARLGQPVRLRRGVDLDEDEGVLIVGRGTDQHATVLKAGLIFDGDGTVWEHAMYLTEKKYRVLSLLVRADEC